MREIKFRGWSEKRKEMLYYGNWFTLHQQTVLCFEHGIKRNYVDESDIDYPDRVHLMQYTGLKDRNGKEIYENDIIQFIDIPARFNIVWDDEDACWNAEHIGGNSTRQALRKSGAKHKEVVGNIYETN